MRLNLMSTFRDRSQMPFFVNILAINTVSFPTHRTSEISFRPGFFAALLGATSNINQSWRKALKVLAFLFPDCGKWLKLGRNWAEL